MKDVTISVRTLQRNEAGEDETMELVTKGIYEEDGDVRILRYNETELTGMEGTTTTIEVHPHFISLIRTGKVSQRQEFHPGQTHRAQYNTPFGSITLAMHTYEMNHRLEAGNGEIQLRYDVALDGLYTNYNELTIKSREDKHYGYTK